MKTVEEVQAAFDARVAELQDEAVAFIAAAGGAVPIGDLRTHMAALERSDSMISRAVASGLSFGRLGLARTASGSPLITAAAH